MKKLSILLISFIFSTMLICQKTNSTPFQYNHVIKLSPFELGRTEFKISYEHYLNQRKSSIVLTPILMLRNEVDDKRNGWQLMGQYRYYVSHLNKANENAILRLSNFGFYAGIYGLYSSYQDSYQLNYWDNIDQKSVYVDRSRDIQSQEGGALIGVQIDITKRIAMDFYIGGGVRVSQSKITGEQVPSDTYIPSRGGLFPYEYTGVKPTVGFMMGILL